MTKAWFWIGLLAGWLLSLLVPPPPWLARRIQKIFFAGQNRIEESVQDAQKAATEQLRDKVEREAGKAEKNLRD